MQLEAMTKRLSRQFGPNAQHDRVGHTEVIHIDKPSKKERAKRLAEVKNGGPKDEDCALCKALAKSPPSVVIYDRDAVLCFGQDQKGPYANGYPRTSIQKSSTKARKKKGKR
jgi:hypothetical protein